MKRLFPALIFILLSCGGPRVFVHPEADLPYYKKIGILPFANLSGTREVGEKISMIFYTELMLKGQFDLVTPGEVRKKLREVVGNKATPEKLGISDIMKVGEALGAQGIIEGVVIEYSTIRSGGESYPIITLDVRMIDTKFGKVVWEMSYTMTGRPKVPILGIGGVASLPELSEKICRRLAEEIVKRMKAGYEE